VAQFTAEHREGERGIGVSERKTNLLSKKEGHRNLRGRKQMGDRGKKNHHRKRGKSDAPREEIADMHKKKKRHD